MRKMPQRHRAFGQDWASIGLITHGVGDTRGLVVGHVYPEAWVGGPIPPEDRRFRHDRRRRQASFVALDEPSWPSAAGSVGEAGAAPRSAGVLGQIRAHRAVGVGGAITS